MEPLSKLPPVSRKKTKLDPITPDVLRRTTSGFGVSENSKATQALVEENEQLRNELEIARKEIFRLKEENLELKKLWKTSTVSSKSTFLTSSSFGQNGGKEDETKCESGEIICNNCGVPIAKQNYKLHVIYWEKNLTEWSYCKMKLNRADLDAHIEEERGTYADLLEAATNNKISDLETMYEHGNDIFAVDDSDVSKNTLLHVAVRNWNKEAAEFLIKKGIDVNVKNKNDETPLHLAIGIKDENKAVYIIEAMLLKGANPYSKDKLGDTPIEKAKRSGKSNILLLFAECSSDRVSTPSLEYRN